MKHLRVVQTTIIFASLLLVTSACKQRNFSNNKSNVIADPDTPQVCKFKLEKDAPYTTDEFKKKLAEALNKAAKSGILKEENLRDFLFADEVAAALKGQLTLTIDDCALTRAINESVTKPSKRNKAAAQLPCTAAPTQLIHPKKRPLQQLTTLGSESSAQFSRHRLMKPQRDGRIRWC